jgi:hypothetical protein
MRRLQALGAAGVPDAARTGQVAVVAVVLSCAVFLAGGLAACAWWQYSGATFWLDFWFKELGGPLLVAYAVVEALAAAAIVRLFDPGEPMRTAWQLLRAAACVHAASALFRHFLGKPVAANPLRLWHAPPGWLALCEEFGRVLGGTLYLAVLMAGLAAALRVYARLRLLPAPSAREWTVLCAAAGILVYTLRLIAYWLRQPGVQTSSLWWVGWLTDPLLGALLFLALLVRRAAAPLEGGPAGAPVAGLFPRHVADVRRQCLGGAFHSGNPFRRGGLAFLADLAPGRSPVCAGAAVSAASHGGGHPARIRRIRFPGAVGAEPIWAVRASCRGTSPSRSPPGRGGPTRPCRP